MMNKNIVSRVFCFKWFERVHLKFFESFGLNGKCLIAVHLKNKNLVIVVTQAGRMLKQDLGKSHCAFCLNQWLCKIWMQQNLIPLISRCCRNTCTCIIIQQIVQNNEHQNVSFRTRSRDIDCYVSYCLLQWVSFASCLLSGDTYFPSKKQN